MKTLVAVTIFILFVSNAFAAEVSWMYVQHRRYENGRIFNRLVFGLVDEKGHNLPDGSSVADVKLYAPGGDPVKLSKYKFDSDEEIFGLYDALDRLSSSVRTEFGKQKTRVRKNLANFACARLFDNTANFHRRKS